MINLYAGKRDIFAAVKGSSGKTEPIPGGDVRHPGQRWRTSPAALRQGLPHIFLPAVPDCHSTDMTNFAAKMKTQ